MDSLRLPWMKTRSNTIWGCKPTKMCYAFLLYQFICLTFTLLIKVTLRLIATLYNCLVCFFHMFVLNVKEVIIPAE